MTKERSGTVWGVDLQVSDNRVVLLSAFRSMGGRWSWTVVLYRMTKRSPVWDRQIDRGIAATLTLAKPAAEAVTRDWLIEQIGPTTHDTSTDPAEEP